MTAKFSASADGTKVNIGNAAEDALQIDSTAKTIKPVAPYQMGGNGPAFRANLSVGNQTVPNNTYTKVICNNEAFDTNNSYDPVAGRFQPNVAGIYQVNGSIHGIGSPTIVAASIYLNGGNYAASYIPATGVDVIVSVSTLVKLNGTTDFLELYGLVTGTTPQFAIGITQFSAALVRQA